MASTTLPGGTFKLADDLILTRMGYGAMQLAGPHVFGPPNDHDGAAGAVPAVRAVASLLLGFELVEVPLPFLSSCSWQNISGFGLPLVITD